MKILICGFMGAGKSSMLSLFEKNDLGYQCFDTDHEIAKDLGLLSNDLGEWIEVHGIELFRHIESTKIQQLLERHENQVIALGGGSLNAKLILEIMGRPDCRLVFLHIPLEKCFDRIHSDHNRPLLKKTKKELHNIYETRLKLYIQSHLVLTEDEIKEIDGLESLVHNLSSR